MDRPLLLATNMKLHQLLCSMCLAEAACVQASSRHNDRGAAHVSKELKVVLLMRGVATGLKAVLNRGIGESDKLLKTHSAEGPELW